MGLKDQIKKMNQRRFKRYLLFAVLFMFAVSSFIITGCARYKDLPSGTSKAIRGSGFSGFDLAELQKPATEKESKGESRVNDNQALNSLPLSDSASGSADSLASEIEDKDYSALKPFGYDFFRAYPKLQASRLQDVQDKKIIPVPRQYRIGHGDRINVFLAGNVKKKYELPVDANGKIEIPGAGHVFVTGMTFEEMSMEVISKVAKTAKVPVDISMNARNTITVYFSGEVHSSVPHTLGAFSSVTEALLVAGGPKENGSLRNIQVRRKGITVAVFDLYELLLKGIKIRDITLMQDDEIIVPQKGTTVGITGSVERPATYELKDNENLETLIALAGGVLPEAKDLRIQIKRITGNERKIIYDVSEEEIKLKKSQVPVIKNGDLIHISPFTEVSAVKSAVVDETASKPAEEVTKKEETIIEQDTVFVSAQKIVTLTGEFKRPGRYLIQKGEKLSSVIEKAGGYTGNAYLRGAYLTRESVRSIQQKKLDEMQIKLMQNFFPSGTPVPEESAYSGSVNYPPGENGIQLRFVEYIQSLKATGRLTIKLAHLRLLKNSIYDIEMESGDELHLPVKSNTVNVIGSVMAEGPHVYDDKWDYNDYIAAAGGYSRNADEQNVFVVKVDGSTRKLYRGYIEWSNKDHRWEVTAFGQKVWQIESGDVIVAPEKSSNIEWIRRVKDTTALIMNTAVLTGIVLRLW